MQRSQGGAAGSSRRGAPVRALLLLVAALAIGTSGVLLAGPGPAVLVAFGLSSVPALVMSTCCALTARFSRDRAGRRTWRLLALAGLLWGSAELAWLASFRDGTALAATAVTLLFVAGTAAAIVAMLTVPGRAWRGPDRYRVFLDAAIISGATIFAARSLGLVGRDYSSFALLAYPLSDVMLLSVSLTVLLRTSRSTSPHLSIVAVGLSVYAAGDIVYALRAVQGSYTVGGMLDLSWIAAFWLVAVAALWPTARSAPCPQRQPESYAGQGVPWLLTGLAMFSVPVVDAFGPNSGRSDPVMLLSGFGTTLTFIVRQALLFSDLSRLNRTLGAEVVRKEQISRAVMDGVLVVDGRSRIEFANPTAAALLGVPPHALLGRDVFELVHRRGPDGESVDEVLQTLEAGGQLVSGVALFGREDGGELPVELSVGQLDPGYPGSGVVVVFRDVSEQRKVERMKNEFMSVISHELRTPLASMRGALALLHGGVAGTLEPQGARMVSIALTSSERLSRLIGEILDVERLESGRARLETGAHAADQLVGTATREMAGLALAAEVSLLVTTVSGTVVADADRVVQTLTNLIGNAVKFSDRGSEVRVSAEPRGDEVEFAVVDQGRGIPPEKLEVIFDRFEQVDSSDSREQGGTGLGLSICREIVRLHGGRIWAVSRLGEGAEFRFVLPAASPEIVDDPVEALVAPAVAAPRAGSALRG